MFDRAAVEARLEQAHDLYGESREVNESPDDMDASFVALRLMPRFRAMLAALHTDARATLAALDAATARVRALEAQVRTDHFVRSDGYCLCGNVVPCAVLQRLALAPAPGEDTTP